MSDERIIKREVMNASIDVHPSMPALVIDYDEVNIVLTHTGRESATDPVNLTKTIRLQGELRIKINSRFFDTGAFFGQKSQILFQKCLVLTR